METGGEKVTLLMNLKEAPFNDRAADYVIQSWHGCPTLTSFNGSVRESASPLC